MEKFSSWLLSKNYHKGGHVIYHYIGEILEMNGDAINHFAWITRINQYCPGKQGCMAPLDVREREGSEVSLQA